MITDDLTNNSVEVRERKGHERETTEGHPGLG